jgi:L-lactate dehydrogenase complex protein LldG
MSRETILTALRAAQAQAPLSVPAAPARPLSDPVDDTAWERLAAVLEPLEVRLRIATSPAEAAEHLADIARERHATTYVRWADMPASVDVDLALADLARIDPTPTSPTSRPCPDLAEVDLGITYAHAALIDSGSLVVVAGPNTPRAASLLPAVHLCLIPRSALLPDVSDLPGILNRHRAPDGQLPSCLNLISGPSSTADIELVLVRGVHGPIAVEAVALDWDV